MFSRGARYAAGYRLLWRGPMRWVRRCEEGLPGDAARTMTAFVSPSRESPGLSSLPQSFIPRGPRCSRPAW
ncbi:hypothetical protein cact_06160 [Cutibacterium acnes DSM 1897]|uniref:Uncharacterized protein n=1 Tax=Cutibacterium acnes TaxID=1747 RepID=A0AA44QM53_CUTAC|nr:hypothetical protein HMPREF9612_02349 [Cutibacterium acnes HL063PA2]EFT33899.1 hypothetical protein HMPREF9596_01073 [Cutibacterium acnes HL005PA3]EGE92452.1 hypothetical protein HMPREF9571_01534 [Cutibacterium acnes HL043PA2]PGF36612.1 hypothetical protein B1B09_03095 [Cutibacterium acnes]QAZ48714.1 hypothetical protein cact_06160 [Cutibacterium acnes DSM 1897]